jgi:hypothetical protein
VTSPPAEPPRQTTAAIYTADLEWLKARQLRVSNAAGEWLPMTDVIHHLIEFARQSEGEGA